MKIGGLQVAVCNRPGWPEYGQTVKLIEPELRVAPMGYQWAFSQDGKVVLVPAGQGELIFIN